jgi:ABC-type lipoprotein release transport system permease subunit
MQRGLGGFIGREERPPRLPVRRALDPLTFAAVPAVLFLVAAAACWLPAAKAVRVEATVALKSE